MKVKDQKSYGGDADLCTMRIEQSPEKIVEQHASWIALNPVIGCPYNCSYCFLGPEKLRPMQPRQLVGPEEAIDQLVGSYLYDESLSVAVGTRTDMFATTSNVEYTNSFIKRWRDAEMPNNLVLITKAEIPTQSIQEMQSITQNGGRLLVFLSISGFDSSIERGVNHAKLRGNVDRLSDAGIPVVHYWRPLMPANSSLEAMVATHSDVAGKTSSSFVGGLRLTEDMKRQITDWPEILEIDTETTDSIWEHDGYGQVSQLREQHEAHPIYEAVSCSIALATNTPEKNGIHGTDICSRSNCPDDQRTICSSQQPPSYERVANTVKNIPGFEEFKYADGIITVQNVISADHTRNLAQKLGVRISAPSMSDPSYGWGSHHNRVPVYIKTNRKDGN